MKKGLAILLGVMGVMCLVMEAAIWVSLSEQPVTLIPPVLCGVIGLILVFSAFALFRER